MKTLTLEQIHSLIFLFGVFFVVIPAIISFIVGFECQENKGDNIKCFIANLIFLFEFFIICYMAFNDSKITKNLFSFINKGEFSVDVFYYLLIASVEVLLFFSAPFFVLVFSNKENDQKG
ncbi:hypothetical protein [Caminibacter mediatlanticus]|uniref:Uncharacterized protein n=1 Tax=Caminibacter mediatlanticus TB-2 TaxID=391592 RepID=A0AAI9F1P0_9BACT|nr:hypothetical protein [Caminibacter mediatlanticus]EDM22953.1 hypothetical protein CMTB2_05592 [Caminibacter mediatlanticus TB-2]